MAKLKMTRQSRLNGPEGLLLAVIATAADDYYRGGKRAMLDAAAYFAGKDYKHHISLLGLPEDWLPEVVIKEENMGHFEKLDSEIKAYAAAHKVTYYDAVQRLVKESPGIFEQPPGEGMTRQELEVEILRTKGKDTILSYIRHIEKNDAVPYHVAARRVFEQHPNWYPMFMQEGG